MSNGEYEEIILEMEFDKKLISSTFLMMTF